MTYAHIVTYIMAGLLGVCVGSFLNVVIYRLPNQIKLSKPASHCPQCGYVLKWYDNIPVISYIILGGKCRKCRKHIPFRYTAVELLNMVLWLVCVWRFYGDGNVFNWINMCVSAVVCSTLLVIFFTDLECMIIFDRFNIILLVCGIALTVSDGISQKMNGSAEMTVWEHILGSLLAGGLFFLVFMGALAILKREGLGGGDVKLAAAAGLVVGWKFALLGLLIASVVGSVVLSILNKKTHGGRNKEYPFGPFITGGILISYLFCKPLITWYIDLLVK